MTLFKKHPNQNQPNKNILTIPQEDDCDSFFAGFGGGGLYSRAWRETSRELGKAGPSEGTLWRGPRELERLSPELVPSLPRLGCQDDEGLGHALLCYGRVQETTDF